MDQTPLEKPVQQVVAEVFTNVGVSEAERAATIETILVRQGRYAGHSFQAGGLRALWFVGSDQVEVRDSEGRLIASASTRPDQVRAA